MGKIGFLAVAALAGLGLSGCQQQPPFAPPPRADEAIKVAPQSSIIAVPVTADLSGLAAQLAREVPRTLWTINRKGQTCIASEKIKVAFVKLKTPKVKCDIVGTVTRGKMTIDGRGRDIIVTMPIRAVVRAKDIAGIFKQETATGNARVRAVVRLSLDSQWNPKAKVDIKYDWTDKPHVDLLGQRIEFTDRADGKLKAVVAQLERTLPRELAKLNLKRDIERLWGQAFTSLQLNESNPTVWMRVTPEQLQYGGYSLRGKRLELRLGMKAQTETFVGDRPANPERKPLPPLANLAEKPGKMLFFIPVIADYDELEPVIAQALVNRSKRPFEVPRIGPVIARFAGVEVYGTTGGRVAVGVTFRARRDDRKFGEVNGQVWLTATPVTNAGSRKVTFQDLQITGDSDRSGVDLLFKIAASPGFSQTIAAALAQNFESDYDVLMAKIEDAIDTTRQGDVLIRASIEDVKTGEVKAAGQGLYLPVWGTGTASVELAPR
ncbi:DUF4403 family protein [Qipengyuania marisflavi]|uniref:DUF4403 family protein n=2 Tax=Qipengyuania marisflavi TaxID=2486356 RepID=A0A5S3PAE3_9SPHN|nr:DUF4403 family protein [Qipengyuania marisflavi]